MGWLEPLQGQTVGLDTTPLIYLIEQNPFYLERVRAFFAGMNRGDFQVTTSVITLTEVLVHPLRANNAELAAQYREILFEQENLKIISVSEAIAKEAAQLRASFNLRTPDALQLATATNQGASFFLTNDARLNSLPGLQVLLLNQVEQN